MKKLIFTLAICFVSIAAFPQTTIVLNTGERIPAKRFMIKPMSETMSYKAIDGTTQKIKKADVFCLIRKKNLMTFTEKGRPRPGKMYKNMPELDPSNACSKAVVDAMKNYKTGGPGFGTGVVSFLAWPVGLITATVVSSNPPAKSNLNMDAANASNTQYCECYTKEAAKKKKSSTWLGWGLGTTFGITAGMLILMSVK